MLQIRVEVLDHWIDHSIKKPDFVKETFCFGYFNAETFSFMNLQRYLHQRDRCPCFHLFEMFRQ